MELGQAKRMMPMKIKQQRPKQVVAALIVKDEDRRRRILICQRTQHQSMPLKWEFPGGKIETGEQARDALKRELEEELGIDATIDEEVARIRHKYATGSAIELRFFLVLTFRGEIENRIFKQVLWATPQELPEYDFLEADIELVKQLAVGGLLPP